MAAWRCFVGLPLPQAYQDGLEHARKVMGHDLRPPLASRLAWTRPGNWHLTLKFLGDVDEATVPGVIKALGTLPWEAFVMQGGGAGVFPPQRPPKAGQRPRPPRVLWVGLTRGARECAALARNVDAALEPLGFGREKRPFTAHLTLARVRRPERDDWDAVARVAAGLPWPAFSAQEMVIWRSVLSAEGPLYTRLESFQPPGLGLP